MRKIVEKSKAELPVGFEMPKAKPLPKLQESVSDLLDDDDFAAYVRVFKSAGACVWLTCGITTGTLEDDDDDDAEPEEEEDE